MQNWQRGFLLNNLKGKVEKKKLHIHFLRKMFISVIFSVYALFFCYKDRKNKASTSEKTVTEDDNPFNGVRSGFNI